MKVIKPQRLGLLTRVYEHKRRLTFTATIFGFFPFASPSALFTEASMWKFAAEELGKDAAIDLGMPKPRGELLVAGRGYTRGGSQPVCAPRVKIGAIDKTLYVIGDRQWRRGVATDPVPFTEMPITWENAFGGAGYAANPLGKGFAPIKTDGGEVHPLPNVEDPRRLVRSPGDRPAPAGFGPYDFTWPQRFSKAGTYDRKWLEERFPGLADDLDPRMFNSAPEDQQIDGFFRGDEAFQIEHMHPTEAAQGGRLPGLAARCFITQRTPGGDAFHEIPTRLDTVHLFPHAGRGLVVCRGVIDVAEDDAADVLHLVAGWERIGSPKPLAHYQDVLRQRLDGKMRAIASLRDKDLMHDPPTGEGAVVDPADEVEAMKKLVAQDGAMLKNMRRRAEIEHATLREKIAELGLDPDEHVAPLPAEETPPDLDDLGELVEKMDALAEKTRADAEKQRAESEAHARAICAENGLDFDKLVEDERKKSAGPPKFRARAQMDHLRELAQLARNSGVDLPHVEVQLADPRLEEKLVGVERQLHEAYKKFAQHFPAAARLDGEPAVRLREEVIAGVASGAPFFDRDLTGADLGGLDLRRANLRGAMMESTNLEGADLSGADLSGAVLARANLTGTKLAGAKLVGANLGAAELARADLTGADLCDAVLADAKLTGADLTGAKLDRADLLGASFASANLSRVTAPSATFLKCDLAGTTFAGADLTKARFIEVDIGGVDCSGATLDSAVFVSSKAEKAIFRGAKLEKLRLVKDCVFDGADFDGASLPRAHLRGASLVGASFRGATLDGADLSESRIEDGRLDHVTAKGALFVRTDLRRADLSSANLMYAILQKANLRGATLQGANLFRADLLRANVDGGTQMQGAVLTQIRFVEARSDGQG